MSKHQTKKQLDLQPDLEVPSEGSGCESCHGHGPGYPTPLAAMQGPRERLIYVPCIRTGAWPRAPDYLATVDVDPESPTYCQMLHICHRWI
ncbi:hypothetical protein lerEdw1_010646 [Lerista edwardsae]|nr:hypothetical protein lerEdw1_010646 [Lerista edwardsae]